ncbi:hypothetical protein [Rhizobium sp. BK176]|uniref:hypothetical protein n=1 Tax=Rhizobium sp. BK176 TaxID=2587071 RepID=UPI00216913D1|nr:hypothetical protein [Rhizobium sp. BK176]MCS4088537.1 putative DNA-binding protein YlxM (UPF0122 family) [Rhizobium sp. BK176]
MTETFSEISDRYSTAEVALSLAAQRLQSDKDRRKASLIARFVDFVSETDAEENERKAREEFESVKADTERQVAERLHDLAMSEIAEDADVASRRSIQDAERGRSLKVLQDVEQVLAVARVASTKIEEATDACKSASSMEMMDAFTSNKAISAMSHMKTSNAKSKLTEAKAAIEALCEAMPDRGQKLDAEEPDDFLDLVLDFADFPIDFMSWINKGKLDTAAKQCAEAQERVAEVIADLSAVEEKRRLAYEHEAALLAEIDRPYLIAALEFIPTALRFAIPEHLADVPVAPRGIASPTV